MLKQLIKIYNQSLDRYTRQGCTVYTLYMIIQLQWGIIVDEKFIKETLKVAEKEKKWFESWWAYFAEIYNWFVWKIKERTDVNISVKTIDINSKEFEIYYNNNYAFGLWLKNWNANYIKHSADWELTKQEIDFIVELGWWFWHNHTYYKWVIFDTIWTLQDQIIKLSLENLRYAVKQGMYYSNARTLVMKDKLLEKYLFDYKVWIVTNNVQDLLKEHIKAIEKASSLRIFKK